jgi:hypothetical protein
MTMRIQFKTNQESPNYTLEGLRILSLNVNNKFHPQGVIGLKKDLLIPNSNDSYLTIECVAVDFGNLDMLQNIAINMTPISCTITLENKEEIIGEFVVLSYSRDNSTGETPEISFKLKSSGNYEIR